MTEDRNQKSMFDTQQDIFDNMRNQTATYQVLIEYHDRSTKVKTFTGKWKHDRDFIRFFREEYYGAEILDYKKI